MFRSGLQVSPSSHCKAQDIAPLATSHSEGAAEEPAPLPQRVSREFCLLSRSSLISVHQRKSAVTPFSVSPCLHGRCSGGLEIPSPDPCKFTSLVQRTFPRYEMLLKSKTPA